MFSTSLWDLVVNLVPVRHNSPCQNREGNHDSSPWSPALLASNKPAHIRSFFKCSFVRFYWIQPLQKCYYSNIRLDLSTCLVYRSSRCKIPRRKLSRYHHRATLFCKEFDVELKNENLWKLLHRLDHFLKVGCCPAATCSHFTVCVTVHIDIWS